MLEMGCLDVCSCCFACGHQGRTARIPNQANIMRFSTAPYPKFCLLWLNPHSSLHLRVNPTGDGRGQIKRFNWPVSEAQLGSNNVRLRPGWRITPVLTSWRWLSGRPISLWSSQLISTVPYFGRFHPPSTRTSFVQKYTKIRSGTISFYDRQQQPRLPGLYGSVPLYY